MIVPGREVHGSGVEDFIGEGDAERVAPRREGFGAGRHQGMAQCGRSSGSMAPGGGLVAPSIQVSSFFSFFFLINLSLFSFPLVMWV